MDKIGTAGVVGGLVGLGAGVVAAGLVALLAAGSAAASPVGPGWGGVIGTFVLVLGFGGAIGGAIGLVLGGAAGAVLGALGAERHGPVAGASVAAALPLGLGIVGAATEGPTTNGVLITAGVTVVNIVIGMIAGSAFYSIIGRRALSRGPEGQCGEPGTRLTTAPGSVDTGVVGPQ